MKHKKQILAMLLAAVLIIMQLAITVAALQEAFDDATSFVFTDTQIAATEGAYTGYKIEGTTLTINGSGTYVVSGSCADGSIKIKKGTSGVTLVLNGLTLTSSDTAPICCNKSSEVAILAAAGTVNTLTDSVQNNDETYPDNANAENAVIKAKDGAKLTLCGTGTINVISNGKNGVKGGLTTETEGEASLTVRDLTLNITANVNDGLKADQELNIVSGTITVSAADDAIKSDFVLNIGAAGTAGPTILISKSCEGIEAATVHIYSGNITLHAEDDGINVANSDLTDYAYSCNIYGGRLYIDVSNGDGIDSNGSLTITGGTLEVYSAAVGNDGSPLDSDGALSITGGTVFAIGNSNMAQIPNGTAQTYVIFGNSGIGGMTPPDMGKEKGMTPPDMSNAPSESNRTNGTMPGGAPMGDTASASIAAGDTVCVLDASGTVLYTATALRASNYVFFSSNALVSGNSYTLSVNGSATMTATAGTSGGAMTPNMGGAAMPFDQNGANGMMQPERQNTGDRNGTPRQERPNDGSFAPNDAMAPMENIQNAVAFQDVDATAYYAQSVTWATENGITNGVSSSEFAPDEAVTRAQTVTFLWRAADAPEPTTAGFYTDVSTGSYYAKAVAWAAENGITTGTSATTFTPDALVTRAQVVTFLWRQAGCPEAASAQSFRDVSSSSYYAKAVAWATENGITNGTGTDTFSPDAPVTRAQVVTFLDRYAAIK